MAVPIPSEAFEVFDNNEITREKIEQVATLFSQEYGIWGPKGPRPGKRICMSALKLEDHIFPELSLHVDEQFERAERASEYRLVRSLMDGEIIGHATACYWKFVVEELGIATDICWVTQLVVKKDWRGRGIAKQMLRKLNKEPEEGHRYGRPGRTYYGILSSSPFAIMAAWRAFGQADRMIEDSDLKLLALEECSAAKILESGSEIPYLQTAASQLRGTVFDPNSEDGSVCSAFTNFFIDHTEPEEALGMLEARGNKWPFGRLGDGCEYLLIVVGIEKRS